MKQRAIPPQAVTLAPETTSSTDIVAVGPCPSVTAVACGVASPNDVNGGDGAATEHDINDAPRTPPLCARRIAATSTSLAEPKNRLRINNEDVGR